MPLDLSEYRTKVLGDLTDLRTAWRARDVQINEERCMIALTKPKQTKGFVNIVRNDPKVLYDTSVALLSGYEPRLRLPLSSQDSDEQDKMNKAERFLIGVWRELDRQALSLGRDKVLRELAYHVCSGYYNVFPYLETEDGEICFRLEFYDPLTCYPRWGTKGLVKFVRAYWTTRAAAEVMVEENGWQVVIPADQNQVEVVNYWEKKGKEVYNCVLVDGKIAKEPTKEDFENIPILSGTVSGRPPGYLVNELAEIRHGESVITTNIDTYEQTNKLTSLMLQIVQDTAYPPLQDITQGGEPSLRPEDLGSGKIIPRRLNEPIEPLKRATTPVEVNVLQADFGAAIQRGGLPFVIYGGLPFELSGFALSQLMAAIKHKLAPFLNTYSYLVGQISTEYLRQFKLHGKAIELAVETRERRGKGETYMEEFKPDDLPKVRFVEATVPLAVPADKAQQIIMARQAMQPPALLSRPTLWDEYLDVQDQKLEYQRIVDDNVLDLPVMKTITMIERLRDKAAAYESQGQTQAAAALTQYADLLTQQLAAPQGSQPGLGGTGSPPNMTSGAGGMPGEMTGVSPDMVQAMMGKVPTGEAGKTARPQGV